MTYTAEAFLSSPAFVKIAIDDAVALLAKTNNQSIQTTYQAFQMGVENVTRQVAKLLVKAAQHCADEANAGRMWK